MRIGQGFDVHAFQDGGSLVLGGVTVPFERSLAAHSDGDVVLVPKGHHPCGAPYGYDMYYLNVMAGPRRNWRFQNHPDHDWIFQRDK